MGTDSCGSDASGGGFRGATTPPHTRAAAWAPPLVWAGAARKALRGEGLRARPGDVGLEVQPAVQPREAGAQSTFQPFGPCFPASKGQAVSDRGKGAGRASARAQGPDGSPEQPGPGRESGARTSGPEQSRRLAAAGRRAGSRRLGPSLPLPANGRRGRPWAGHRQRLKLSDALPSSLLLS